MLEVEKQEVKITIITRTLIPLKARHSLIQGEAQISLQVVLPIETRQQFTLQVRPQELYLYIFPSRFCKHLFKIVCGDPAYSKQTEIGGCLHNAWKLYFKVYIYIYFKEDMPSIMILCPILLFKIVNTVYLIPIGFYKIMQSVFSLCYKKIFVSQSIGAIITKYLRQVIYKQQKLIVHSSVGL